MKRFLIAAVVVFVVVVGVGFAWLALRKPKMAPPVNVKIEGTPERLARGKYLYEAVTNCDGCHGDKDTTKFGMPVVAKGAGFEFPPEMGLPGAIHAKNITPDEDAGIGKWTDGEILRAFREGIGKDERVLFPMMPYKAYRKMSDEDAFAVVAYMRTLPPSKKVIPATKVNFPVNLMVKGVPQPVDGVVPPVDKSDKVKYGEYLVTIGSCVECHTPMQRGQMDKAKMYAGGREFKMNGTRVISQNITPDPETGIGKLNEDQFLEKFYQYKDYVKDGPPKVGPEGFTVMPWLGLAQMEDGDLRAVYAYLKTLKPVVNAVESHPDAPKK